MGLNTWGAGTGIAIKINVISNIPCQTSKALYIRISIFVFAWPDFHRSRLFRAVSEH